MHINLAGFTNWFFKYFNYILVIISVYLQIFLFTSRGDKCK